MGFLSVLGKIGKIAANVVPAILTGGGSLPATLAATAIGVGGDIAGDLINRGAIRRGQNAQTGNIDRARQEIASGRDLGVQANRDALAAIEGRTEPYMDVGEDALYSLRDSVDDERPGFQYDPSQVEKDPAFDFIMSEAMKGLSRSAAGKMRLNSGDTYKELLRYSTGLASREYGAADERTFRNQKTTYDSMTANRQRREDLLLSLTGAGERARSETNAATRNSADNISDLYTRSGGQFADLSLGEGNVRASGYAAGARNTGSLIDDIVGGVGDFLSLRDRRSRADDEDINMSMKL